MNANLLQFSWPPERLGEAVEALGHISKLSAGSTHITDLPHKLDANDDEALGS